MKRAMLVLLVMMIATNVNAQASVISKLKAKYPKARVYTSRQIDKRPTILTKRKNRYTLIEKIKGVVLNNKGDGRITNTTQKYYNYISYRGVKGAKKGRRVITYCVYDNSNEIDTIVKRIDIVRKKVKR